MIADSVRNQSIQIFANIEILFEAVPEEEYPDIIGGFKTWKHFYHLLHSMDKNFMNPDQFSEPVFHEKNMDILFMDTRPELTKKELLEYYGHVKEKIQKYLALLDDRELGTEVCFRNMKLTKMELYIAQLRHIFYHVGYLHCCIKMKKGETPEYAGLYKTVPEQI